VIGAVAGGPIGAVAGGVTGALLGEHYHKQKVLNHELAADLSGSKADAARLTQTVSQLGGSLDRARDLALSVSFRTGDAQLSADDVSALTTLGGLVDGMNAVKIQVSGYADPRGSQEFNAALSKQRAESVAAVLAHAGLSQDRIVIEARGANGASVNGNLDDYAMQRRVTVKLIDAAAVADGSALAPTTVAAAQ
jgi:outer membrane protein OmpA-like peptidoglycan-associated protein